MTIALIGESLVRLTGSENSANIQITSSPFQSKPSLASEAVKSLFAGQNFQN